MKESVDSQLFLHDRTGPSWIQSDLDSERYWNRTPYRPGGGFAIAEEEEHLIVDEANLDEAGLTIDTVTIDDRTYNDGLVEVRFDPLGTSSWHTIVLSQPLFERSFTIEVLPLTGEIRFHDGLFERELAEERDFE